MAPLRIRRTIRPGRKGTHKLQRIFGERLVCVRYRYDEAAGRRYTTVELIVDSGPWARKSEASESPGRETGKRPGKSLASPASVDPGGSTGAEDSGSRRPVKAPGTDNARVSGSGSPVNNRPRYIDGRRIVEIRIDPDETELAEMVREYGGRRNPRSGAWSLQYRYVADLMLSDRIILS